MRRSAIGNTGKRQEEKRKKNLNSKDYSKICWRILADPQGKSWSSCLYFKTELPYHRHTHKADKIARPNLFRLNGTLHKKLISSAISLSDDWTNCATVADLPGNEDAISVLGGETREQQTNVLGGKVVIQNMFTTLLVSKI